MEFNEFKFEFFFNKNSKLVKLYFIFSYTLSGSFLFSEEFPN